MSRQMSALGARVRAARKARGWTLQELASRASVATNTANSVELGRSVRPGNLRAVLHAVGLRPDDEAEDVEQLEDVEDEGIRLALDLVEHWLLGIEDPDERTHAVRELTRFVMLPH